MSETIIGRFDSRRSADLAIEHLVQEHGIERTDIFVEPASERNSAGVTAAGADAESGHPGVDPDPLPALEGAIDVSVDVNGESGDIVRKALTDAGGSVAAG
ncbi:hypothetical protein FHS96_000956 [Sphingomonas zeicaulis]|uniref:hypothetical protein n=1 Tax=Sphingomonas zeicaulis TaxID=1632740 RepID=UPI003D19588B